MVAFLFFWYLGRVFTNIFTSALIPFCVSYYLVAEFILYYPGCLSTSLYQARTLFLRRTQIIILHLRYGSRFYRLVQQVKIYTFSMLYFCIFLSLMGSFKIVCSIIIAPLDKYFKLIVKGDMLVTFLAFTFNYKFRKSCGLNLTWSQYNLDNVSATSFFCIWYILVQVHTL